MTIREDAINELVRELVGRSLAAERVERSELLRRVLKMLPDGNLFAFYTETFGKVLGQPDVDAL